MCIRDRGAKAGVAVDVIDAGYEAGVSGNISWASDKDQQ